MNILVLDYKDSWHSEAGGAQVCTSSISRVWANQGHCVTIFTSSNGRPKNETIDGVKYIRMGSKFTVFRFARNHLKKNVQTYGAVLDTVNQRPFFAYEIVGKKAITLVHHIGEELWHEEFGFPFDIVGRYILEPRWLRRLRNAPCVLTMSPSTSHSLNLRGIKTSGIVFPAVDTNTKSIAKEKSDHPRLVFIGRLVNNKRPFDVIKAFELIREVFPEAQLDIIGDGYLFEKIKSLEAPGLHVHGFVSEEEKWEILALADILLVTSVREGWGLVVTEAATLGVPAVGYNVLGLRDSIIEGVTGFLCAETPSELASRALSLLNDPELREKMGAEASQRANAWHWADVATRLFEFMDHRSDADQHG